MFKRFDFFLSTPSLVVVRCTAPIKQQISGGEDIVLRLGHQHSVREVIGEIRGEGNLAYGGCFKKTLLLFRAQSCAFICCERLVLFFNGRHFEKN